MKNQLFAVAGSVVVVAAALLLPAVAQNHQPLKVEAKPGMVKLTPMRPAQVSIKCTPGGNSDVATKVELQNTSAAPIPAGKKIFWKTNAGVAGQEVLPVPLAVNAKLNALAVTPSNSTACAAYFVK